MAVYCIFEIQVTDPKHYRDYVNGVPASIEQYGGEYLVRGGDSEVLEGDWQPGRMVVLRFPSMEQARRWHNSDEYAGPKAIRQRSALTRAIMVEGIDE